MHNIIEIMSIGFIIIGNHVRKISDKSVLKLEIIISAYELKVRIIGILHFRLQVFIFWVSKILPSFNIKVNTVYHNNVSSTTNI